MASIRPGVSGQKTVDEYVVQVPKNPSKKYNVMRFGGGDMMDIQKWMGATISRDMSGKKIYQEEEVYPEFGAGSEYGRKRKEEARKLKYGMRRSKFDVDNQPWNLSVVTTAKAPYSAKSKNKDKMVTVTKEFAGRKEGGIGEGSMYFVFFQRPNNTFDAYPVDSWYNFTRKIKHRTLTDEEAEAEWEKRDKIMNHLNFMARKRLQIDGEKEEEEEDEGKGKKKKGPNKGNKNEKESGLLIHDEPDDDELLMSESDDSSDEEKKKQAKKLKKQKGLKHDAPEEAQEESDDGDGEGEEQDYNSDISSDEEMANDSKVAPKGLDEEESSSSSDEEEEAKPEEGEEGKQKSKNKGSGDEMSTSGESDVDSDIESSAVFINGRKTPTKGKKGSNSNSRSSTPNSELLTGAGTKKKLLDAARKLESSPHGSPKGGLLGKRHAMGESSDVSTMKRQKMGGSGSGTSTPTKDFSKSQNVLSEDTVRRYLQHKPITPKDLLKKFKPKKTGLTSEEIVSIVAGILKKLNPEQKKLNGKMHLFLK